MSMLAGDQTLWEAREKGSPVRWLIQVSPQAQRWEGWRVALGQQVEDAQRGGQQ